MAAYEGENQWVVAWTNSAQGPYPVGNPAAQPDLRFALPAREIGARNQNFRIMVRPSLWGRKTRLRLTNVFGLRPVVFNDVFIGLQLGSSALAAGTNQRVLFDKATEVILPPGASVWSDPVELPFVTPENEELLWGRRLALSFHIIGESGPLTWHAKSMSTSYIGVPGAGSKSREEGEAPFPFSTTSSFLVDALDMSVSPGSCAVVAFGDSITDGTASTLNGDDRWPDVLSRRLYVKYGNKIAVANAGIGGNQVAGPADYSNLNPVAGGPAMKQRLERDVLSLSGVSAVICFAGINDLGKKTNTSVASIWEAMEDIVARIKTCKLRAVGATVTSALGAADSHGSVEQDRSRNELNALIRSSKLFDHVIDFDRALKDPETGRLRSEFVPNSTVGGPGDCLHPNRFGYLRMGMEIDIDAILGEGVPRAPFSRK